MLLQRVKPLARLLADRGDDSQPHSLKKTLGPWSLMAMGVGAIIGTGTFVLTGVAAATRSGPSLTISFIVAGIASAFAALCYSEVATQIPIAGSAYTFAYASLGEFIAWIIGWDLVLEYALGAATVSIGWSGYFVGVYKERLWTGDSPGIAAKPLDRRAWAGRSRKPPAIFNLPAFLHHFSFDRRFTVIAALASRRLFNNIPRRRPK